MFTKLIPISISLFCLGFMSPYIHADIGVGVGPVGVSIGTGNDSYNNGYYGNQGYYNNPDNNYFYYSDTPSGGYNSYYMNPNYNNWDQNRHWEGEAGHHGGYGGSMDSNRVMHGIDDVHGQMGGHGGHHH